MAGDLELLQRYKPVVHFDSHEAFFAHDVRAMADCTKFRLERADRTEVIAAHGPDPDPLSLATLSLSDGKYPNGMAYAKGDHFGLHLDGPDQFTTLAGDYRAMERAVPAEVRNKVFGRLATDAATGDRWLQYWYFYLYNDAQFAGRFDMHEGDWEMVQFKLDAQDAPQVAVYAQHAYAEARPYGALQFDGGRPVVFAGRGSHASYFDAGLHRTYLKHGADVFTELWWDAADGLGPHVDQELLALTDGWVHWEGAWGGTRGSGFPLDGDSPGGPITHGQWTHPTALEAGAREHPREDLAAAQSFNVHRVPGGLELGFDFSAWPQARAVPDRLVVTIRRVDESAPPLTDTLVVDAMLSGVVRPRVPLALEQAYTVAVSIIDSGGRPTAPSITTLPALPPDHPPHLIAPILHALDALFGREAGDDERPV